MANSLKIDNFIPSTDLQSTHIDKTQQAENSRSQRNGKARAAADSASISSLTQQISQGLQQDSPERVARVEEAQNLYHSDGFNVPAAQVADSLIQSALADTALLSEVSGPSRRPSPMPSRLSLHQDADVLRSIGDLQNASANPPLARRQARLRGVWPFGGVGASDVPGCSI